MKIDEMDMLALRAQVKHVDQYFGIWAILAEAGEFVLRHVRSMDISSHIASYQPATDLGQRPDYSVHNNVAVINIIGMLTKYDSSLSDGASMLRIQRSIRRAVADDSIRSIVLVIDSPGGTSAGLEALGNDVAVASKKKRVVAYIDDMAASAAYWIASQASEIVASPMSEVGSIGCYTVLTDSSVAFSNEGIKQIIVKDGDLKGAGVEGVEITPEQIAMVQDLVNRFGSAFRNAVSRGRGMEMARVDAVSNGRLFSCEEAVSLGLVDRIGRLDDVLAELSASETVKGKMKMEIEKHEVVAATIGEIEAACPGCDASFVLAQAKTGATVSMAQSAWIAEQSARMQKMSDDLKAAEAATAEIAAASAAPTTSAPRVPAVPIYGDATTDSISASDPIARWDAEVDARVKSGMTRQAACRDLMKKSPDLVAEYEEAYNARFQR